MSAAGRDDPQTTGGISGQLIYESGGIWDNEPCTAVWAVPVGEYWSRRYGPRTCTKSDGSFQLNNLSPGNHYVLFNSSLAGPNWVLAPLSPYAVQWWPHSHDPDSSLHPQGASVVEVRAGATSSAVSGVTSGWRARVVASLHRWHRAESDRHRVVPQPPGRLPLQRPSELVNWRFHASFVWTLQTPASLD